MQEYFDNCGWQIATRYLIPELAGARLTPKHCTRVADAFVSKYGKYAGWAQTLLFIAELPSQKTILPPNFWATEENEGINIKPCTTGNGPCGGRLSITKVTGDSDTLLIMCTICHACNLQILQVHPKLWLLDDNECGKTILGEISSVSLWWLSNLLIPKVAFAIPFIFFIHR